MPPTTYMLLTLPTEGGSDDVWDTILDTALTTIDAHDHTTSAGRKVPSAGININAELEFNANRAIELAGAAFSVLGADLTTGSYELYVSPAGDLKFRNGSGTNVRITSGSALDMTTVGGIAGDYTSVAAEVAYVDASDAYTFKQQVGAAVRQYAKIDAADLRLYEYKAHPAAAPPTNFVSLKSPAALAGSYTLTLPGALPGSQLLAQVTAAGVITLSNTVPGAVSLGSTLGVTGLITATAGLTAAANQHVTVSGTGEFKHGAKTRPVSPLDGQGSAYTLGAGTVTSTGGQTFYLPIPMDVGERITNLSLWLSGDGVMDVTIDLCLYSIPVAGSAAAPTRNVIATTGLISNPSANWQQQIPVVTASTIATGEQLVIEYQPNAANLRIGPAVATYTRP